MLSQLTSAVSSRVHSLVTRQLVYGILLGVSLSVTSTSLALYFQQRRRDRIQDKFEARPIELRSDEVLDGVTGLIGNTPLVRINSLSDALGVEILGKAEVRIFAIDCTPHCSYPLSPILVPEPRRKCQRPCRAPKYAFRDMTSCVQLSEHLRKVIEDAERQGLLYPHTGSRIFEGTVGSTGISIATIAKARGYEATIILPDDVAEEKVKALLSLGAVVERVRPASIVDKKQFVNLARDRAANFGEDGRMSHSALLKTSSSSVLVATTAADIVAPEHGAITVAEEHELKAKPRGFFADQFENKSNYDAHFDGTGPEIWRQTSGRIDAFVSGAGTGGTISGIGQFLKSMRDDVLVVLVDPEGSGLYNKIKYGVMFDAKEAEGTKRRHQVDTVVEGIGINRLTKNIEFGLDIVDDAFRITDAEAVAMSRYLVQHDGLFLGSSSACNLVACVKFVKQRGWREGQRLVTILCDSGNRHYSKFWNDDYLQQANIPIDSRIIDDLLSSSTT